MCKIFCMTVSQTFKGWWDLAKKEMLFYETNLANIDPEKATRATLWSPILYLLLEYHKRF